MLIGLVTPVTKTEEDRDLVEHCNKQFNECTKVGQKKKLIFSDEDVSVKYQIPLNYDMEDIIYKITHPDGPGWIKLEGMYSEKDVEMARERVIYHTNTDYYMNKLEKHESNDELHNNYRGLVWKLINKGVIFQKLAQHPVILNISDAILGQNSQFSSFAANTVLPGMKGQLPHLDYPYYRNFLPVENPTVLDNAPPLALQFVTLLTDFTEENGGTGIRPYSHIKPRYPDDVDDFFAHLLQMTGKAGDVVLFHGAIQHCAMPNKSKNFRSGILQHMAPVYVRPFEDIRSYAADEANKNVSPTLKRLMAIDHPYPIIKT